MSNEPTSKPLHPFWDRSIRGLLRRPKHLRALIGLFDPDLAERLDFERLERIERSFVLEDYRQREADLVVRLPYQADAGQQEVIVYLLLEHQSTVDAWMPFRLLFYMLRIWDEERKRVEATDEGAGLSPIIPAVFYTGTRPWTASRKFESLIGVPALAGFAPRFDILYCGLADTKPAALEAIGPFGWALRAYQRADADRPEFAAVLARAARAFSAIRPLLGDEWRELFRFLYLLIRHRRPQEEANELKKILEAAADDPKTRTELMTMSKTLAEVDYEKGFEEGREEVLNAFRRSILRIGRRQCGEPSAVQCQRLDSITDLAALEALSEAVMDARSWDALLEKV
jgi:hypothetical protein